MSEPAGPERPPIVRRIADPVHGTIGLTDIECRIVDTSSFQRLRRVKHLGLAFLVFPSADFSRFAHSLGVCHVTGMLLDALGEADKPVDSRTWQLCRLAGLLHDIGHYPMSHALERPVIEVYGEKSAGSALAGGTKTETHGLTHEELGVLILEEDSEIRMILQECEWDFQPNEVSDLFNRALRSGTTAVKRS